MRHVGLLICATLFATPLMTPEASADSSAKHADTVESPWLLVPTASSSPKLGNSIGFLAGYLHTFDESSPVSTFAIAGSKSDTQSNVYGGFGRVYFNGDKQRLIAAIGQANIENEYQDYLGTGLNVRTTDDANFGILRYLHRVHGQWFVGGQLIKTDYKITGRDEFSKLILESFGINGFSGNAAGLAVESDTRDNQNDPRAGDYFQLTASRYAPRLGGDVDFGVWDGKYSAYVAMGHKHTLASRITARITQDAPISGYSSVGLRGYTTGEYLAPHNTTIEIEDRYRLTDRWGATAFVGASCLYGGKETCGDRDNWYPAAGAGLTYLLKPKEKMVVRAEIAVGKNDNYGFYLQFGNAF